MERGATQKKRMRGFRWNPGRIIAVYLLLGALWILISDRLLAAVIPQPDVLTKFQTYKGWVFIAVTGWVLYVLIHRYIAYIQRVAAAADEAGEELKERRGQLEFLVDASNIGFWDWDLRTDHVYFSPAWKRQIGYEDHEIPNRFEEWQSRVHPDDFDRAYTKIKAFFKAPRPDFENEFRFRHKDGSYRWILAKSSLSHDEAGNPARMTGCHIDMTEQKNGEVSIRRERDFSEAILNSLPGVFYLYDQNLRFLRWNKNFEKVTGYSSEEVAGMSPLDFFAGPDKELLAARIREVFEKGTSSVEADFVAKDGTRTPYYFTGLMVEFEGRTCLLGVGVDIAKRVQAEKEVEQSRQQLQSILDNSPSIIFMKDLEGRYILYNCQWRRLFNPNHAELRGKTDYDIFPRELAEEFRANDRRVVESRSPMTFEESTRLEDGMLHAYISTKFPILDHEGIPFAVCGISTDITERKEMESALRKNEMILSLFVAHAPAAIAMFDGDMTYIAASRRYLEDYRLGGQDVVGRSHYDVFPEMPERWKEIHRRCLAGAIEKCEADPFPRADGKTDWVRWEIRPWEVSAGDIGGIILFSEVITERKEMEAERQQRSAEIEAVSEILRSLVTRRDLKEILNSVLSGAISLTGLEGGTLCLVNRDEKTLSLVAARKASPEVVAELSAQAVKIGDCLCGNAAETGEPLILWDNASGSQYATLEAVRNEGIRFHAAFPLMVKDHATGVLCLFARSDRKPTDRVLELVKGLCGPVALAIENARLFQEIRGYADELENRVARRTHELEAKNRELETFSYSVSHDLKAPLRGIDGYSRLLLQDYADKLDDDARFFLHTIRGAVGQMNQLITDLLAYAKLERREQTVKSVNPRAIMDALVDDRKEEILSRTITISIDIPFDSVTADADGLALAFRNLLDNAVKFTYPDRPPRIDIGGRETENSHILWIKDNGIGFDPRYHERIFDIFHRLHRMEDFPGTGIGLAMVQKAMQRIGGRAWAEGEPGQGAAFYLEIPK